MTPFTTVSGRAAPLMKTNIDTDVIIRIERLTSGERGELGTYALEALRYKPDGSENPDFVLNQPKYWQAPILIAGSNFGCGSSREGAVWALMAMGLRCIIAESFGDIFLGNCFQNGLLPIRFPATAVQSLVDESLARDEPFAVDLTRCLLTTPTGRQFVFTVDALRRESLLTGLDDVGLTLRCDDEIAQWQTVDRVARPWIWTVNANPLS
ncbi:3-isopropylmalate dehydratase small subunit [Bradyrhizobium genosp. A]|uniref:3-isopropylmalate dehydratase small subunit n=1 Tax=Bradyrhizobium genosp. A TaxID=83626 RepID=UPI003CE9141F